MLSTVKYNDITSIKSYIWKIHGLFLRYVVQLYCNTFLPQKKTTYKTNDRSLKFFTAMEIPFRRNLFVCHACHDLFLK